MNIDFDEIFLIFCEKENQCGKQSAVLGYDGAKCHADHVLFHHHDEEYAENDVQHIDYYGDNHRNLGVLHADEPSVEAIKHHISRGRPDSYEEI